MCWWSWLQSCSTGGDVVTFLDLTVIYVLLRVTRPCSYHGLQLFQPCVVLGFLSQLRFARDDSCKLYNMNHTEIWNLNNMFESSLGEHTMHAVAAKSQQTMWGNVHGALTKLQSMISACWCLYPVSSWLMFTLWPSLHMHNYTITHASTFIKMWCALVDNFLQLKLLQPKKYT